MKADIRLSVVALVLASVGTVTLADGMIVPVRPDIRVRGHWAVNYHHVTMTVRDQVASVTIDQEFVNTGKGMIEVEYLFPVPPGAAIDAMTLVVNGRELTARLMRADEARRVYEDIVRRKKDPALLEYAGFGLYRTRAFPLEPNTPAKVIVHYDYVCKKDNDLVEVWYPLNTEKFSARPIKDVEVVVDVKSKADITAVYSPTHDLSVDRKGPDHVIATYHEKNALPATDIQVFYKVSNQDIGASFLTYKPDKGKDGYFLLLASPSPRIDIGKVIAKDVVIVLDRSGSMSGQKIAQAKGAVRFVLKHMSEHDRFNVVVYNDMVEPFFDGLVAAGVDSPGRTAEAIDRLDRVNARGGTNIHDALASAMKIISDGDSDGPGRPKYLIFMTDGLPTVGKTDEGTILNGARTANSSAARLFAFGVGYDVNVRLLDKLSVENHGKSDYVKPNENIESKISSLYARIKNPVMTDLQISVSGAGLQDIYPRQLGDLFEGDQLLIVGRYAHSGTKTLLIRGIYDGKQRGFEYPIELANKGDSRFGFVERLWAVRRVGYLMDQIQLHGESKEVIDELVNLSQDYGIMTPYTSFLADEKVHLADREQVRDSMARMAESLAADVSGSRGQRAAMARQKLGHAKRAPAAGVAGRPVRMVGNIGEAAYEEGKVETVANVRQIGNQALYRRGQMWVAANAAKVDLEEDKSDIKTIERYSDAYFALVSANTVEENQILASQASGEQLLVTLRGQAYLIE